jgi:hypothetical protein
MYFSTLNLKILTKRNFDRNKDGDVDNLPISFSDVANTTGILNQGLTEAMDLLTARPIFKAQVENFEIILTTWIHLVRSLEMYADCCCFCCLLLLLLVLMLKMLL